jgi:hypothetical protein
LGKEKGTDLFSCLLARPPRPAVLDAPAEDGRHFVKNRALPVRTGKRGRIYFPEPFAYHGKSGVRKGDSSGLAMLRTLVGGKPTWVIASHEPSIEPGCAREAWALGIVRNGGRT